MPRLTGVFPVFLKLFQRIYSSFKGQIYRTQMTDAQKYQLYSKRIKGCFLALKISLFCATAALVALIVFVAISAGIDLSENAPQSFLIGVIVCAGTTVLFLISTSVLILTVKIFLSKLRKLNMKESGAKQPLKRL